jgi:glycosyltransferase involved in cell wall biosynthesis
MIRVGVDARHLSGHSNGIKTHLVNMLYHSIRKTQNTHEWFLYSPFRIDSINLNFNNVNIIDFPFNYKLKGLHIFFSQILIPFFSKINKVDVIWFPANRASLFLPKNIVQVLTIHDVVCKFFPQTMMRASLNLDNFFMTKSAGKADVITTVSYSASSDIVNAGISNLSKIVVIPNGSRGISSKESSSNVLEEHVDYQFSLFVGTLEPRKNLERLLKAYSCLPKKVQKKCKLLIAGGSGWGDLKLSEQIKMLNLDGKVKLLGYVSDESLKFLYTNARFLVMPSLYEGFGLPLIEAMSYGTPVMTSNNSSMPEVAGNAGIFVDAYSVASISNGLKRMILDDNLLSRLTRNAKHRASKFKWDKSAEKLISVFEKAIKLRNTKLA